MYCDVIASIKTYFRCCVERENNCFTVKKTDSYTIADGEQSPVTPVTLGSSGSSGSFDDLTTSTSSSNSNSNSSAIWSSSSLSSDEYDHNHQYLSKRIQTHNNKLFHPFLYHTSGTSTIP